MYKPQHKLCKEYFDPKWNGIYRFLARSEVSFIYTRRNLKIKIQTEMFRKLNPLLLKKKGLVTVP